MTLSQSTRARRASALVATGVAGILLGTATVHSQVPPHAPPAVTAVPAVPAVTAVTPVPAVTTLPSSPAVSEAQRLSEGFTEVANAVLPAVVTIRVEARPSQEESGGMGGMPFPFPFFGPNGPRGRGHGGGEGEVVHGTGSGVLIRADGVILTNNHVVENARRLSVHLRDGRVLPARVLGTDPATDLALIKVDGGVFPVARWGDSDAARVGEWVLAIGAPFGLEATVTHGVVSAKGRAGLGANQIEDYLQTDASINPGNSGGALVSQVDPTGPSARVGLQPGDVITAINGHPVLHSHDVVREVTDRAPGDRVDLVVLRQGASQHLAVTAGRRPDEPRTAQNDGRVSPNDNGNDPDGRVLGIEVSPLAPQRARQLGVPAGVVVTNIEPGGAAERAGLQPGDVILRADQGEVRTPGDLQIATRDGRAALLVRRGPRQIFMPIQIQ